MQLSNKQIIDIWRRVKEDSSVAHKVTTAVREIIKVFVTCNPTVGFLVYMHGSDTPVFKEKFSDFSMKECKYFLPLMVKPRPDNLVPPKKVYDENTLGAAVGEEMIENLEAIVKKINRKI